MVSMEATVRATVVISDKLSNYCQCSKLVDVIWHQRRATFTVKQEQSENVEF